jgi:signal peptidase II
MPWVLIAIVLAVDQWSKYWVDHNLSQPIEVIHDYFYITYLENDGAAWNMLAGRTVLLELCAFAGIGIFLYLLLKARKGGQTFLVVSYALLIAGAAGNLWDRLAFGYVRDLFQWFPFHYAFPIFNVADVSLTVGVILLLIGMMRQDHKAEKEPA